MRSSCQQAEPSNSALSHQPHAPPPPPGADPQHLHCRPSSPLLRETCLRWPGSLPCSVKKILEPVSPHCLCRPAGICGCSCPLGMHWGCSNPRSPASVPVCRAGLPAHCPRPHAAGLQGPPTGRSTQGPDKSPIVRAQDGAPWGSGPDWPGLSGPGAVVLAPLHQPHHSNSGRGQPSTCDLPPGLNRRLNFFF